ncbi:S26 family signal peptidase [Hamadaea sp. NPDC050747]|uniref:S26 family signal peptidase n=1 Tax=Hamadaea sp. NPDC050747 TaxID=3155789 RepID=UPI0033CC918B
MFGWWPIQVFGPSMAPTLRSGDAVLARRRGRGVRPGDVVVARFPARPDIGLVIKRAVRRQGDGWWVEGDNVFVADDSRAYGVALVEARVVARYWPRPAVFRGRGEHRPA